MTSITYKTDDDASVKKAFDQLMVARAGNRTQVLADLNQNAIAVANANLWTSDLQKTVVLVKEWAMGLYMERGKQCTYNGTLYNIVQSHPVTNPTFTPNAVASLYRPAPFTDPGRLYPRWNSIGLLDSVNNWKLNDRVDHNNKYWRSLVNNNVWEPGVSQWVEITS
jgi:hypothetical protein